MKKLFSALIILASVLMLSGCFFYVEDNSSSYTPPKYNFYFKNDTSYDIRDFYLVDRNDKVYSKGDGKTAYACDAGETLVIKDLEKRDYKVIYEYSKNDIYEFGWFYLDSDKTFVLTEKQLYKGKLN